MGTLKKTTDQTRPETPSTQFFPCVVIVRKYASVFGEANEENDDDHYFNDGDCATAFTVIRDSKGRHLTTTNLTAKTKPNKLEIKCKTILLPFSPSPVIIIIAAMHNTQHFHTKIYKEKKILHSTQLSTFTTLFLIHSFTQIYIYLHKNTLSFCLNLFPFNSHLYQYKKGYKQVYLSSCCYLNKLLFKKTAIQP